MNGFLVKVPKKDNCININEIEILSGVIIKKGDSLLVVDSDVTTEEKASVIFDAVVRNELERVLREEYLNFSFVLIDKSKCKVWFVRDSFGETPAMWQENDSELILASTLAAFEPSPAKFDIDKDALNLYLALTYIPAPYTIYKGIKKLIPGEYLTFSKDGLESKIYYKVEDAIMNVPDSDFMATSNDIREQVRQTIAQYAGTDCGTFLSGGIDSSIVSCVYGQSTERPIDTFSIGFNQKEYNESERADIVVNHIKSNHHLHKLDFDEVKDQLDNIIRLYEEPYSDSSSIPSFFVAKIASEEGMKVALTGDCADELFGGYAKYLGSYYVQKYNSYPQWMRGLLKWLVYHCPVTPKTNRYLRKAKKVIRNAAKTGGERYCDLMSLGFPKEFRSQLLRPEVYNETEQSFVVEYFEQLSSSLTELQKSQIMDVKVVLEGDMFPKMRRVCRQHNLSNIAPFFSKKMVAEAIRLKDSDKVKGVTGKYILREAFKSNLPEETLNKPKRGFAAPMDGWLKGGLKAELFDMLSEQRLKEQALFNPKYVKKLVDDHFAGRNNNYSQLYCLFVFQKWYYGVYKKI